jgi:hypothetical protein
MLRPGRLNRLAVTAACVVAGLVLAAALHVSDAVGRPDQPGRSTDLISGIDHAPAPAVGSGAGTLPLRVTAAALGASGRAEPAGRRVLPDHPFGWPGATESSTGLTALVVAVLVLSRPRRSLGWAARWTAPRGPPTAARP